MTLDVRTWPQNRLFIVLVTPGCMSITLAVLSNASSRLTLLNLSNPSSLTQLTQPQQLQAASLTIRPWSTGHPASLFNQPHLRSSKISTKPSKDLSHKKREKIKKLSKWRMKESLIVRPCCLRGEETFPQTPSRRVQLEHHHWTKGRTCSH